MNEDKDPKQHRREPNIVHEFSEQYEGAGPIADPKTDHLNKNQNDSEDMKLRHEDLDKGNQQKRNDNNSLAFHHKGPPSVLLVELSREQSSHDLQQIQIDEHRQGLGNR